MYGAVYSEDFHSVLYGYAEKKMNCGNSKEVSMFM